MHAPTMTALDFARIQQELAAFAACRLGKELAQAIAPLPSLTLIERAQQETTEAKTILGHGRTIPFGGIQDIRILVQRAAEGGALRPDQLTAVADTVYGCRQLHSFLIEHQAEAPLLTRHVNAFGEFDEVEAEIRRCIERGTVSVRASRSLKQIRNEIGICEKRIQDRLAGILKQVRQYLQEALITTRNGRYVVPVRAGARAAVPGTVHGASGSGSTLFIEPEAIRQLAEELESWRAMEEAEVEQVLAALSDLVATHADGLQGTLGAVAELDIAFARARLSRAWDARPVAWNDAGRVDLMDARHPLLGKSATGNRIRLTPDSRMLIVTGPNTGGKTLLLKTLGLLVIIARCGLHIPVAEGSTLCPFVDVLADIGDNQSLEQSLSTFSGHIANVAPMLAKAGPHTLILLDELGSGTDPHEGTGLGIALLETFLKQGAYTLTTTHLREIKEFGRVTAGCAIAGMGFDRQTLAPTYQLIYGTLGESHALEIAARAGLPATVVERARQLVGGSWTAPAHREGATAPPLPTEVAQASAPAERASSPAAPRPPVSIVLAAATHGRCRVWHEGAEREMAVLDTLRRRLPAGLVVGEHVRVRDGKVVEAANRQNVLVSRNADTGLESVVAANLTRMVITVSARQPDFHATMLTRHLFYAERQGVTPLICLTKGDLVPGAVADEWLKPFRDLGYQALVVSALKANGLDALREALAGQVTAVIGYPGAGKSALLAALTEGELLAVGRQQAPSLRATPLGADGWLVNLPSLRELGVWKPDLSTSFREFSTHAGLCKAAGCLHRQEIGCAVRLAVDLGHLERRRYERYLQLLQHMRLG